MTPPPASSGKRRDGSPRTLILVWCLFLLGSWGVSLQVDSPSSAVRWMTYACVIGMMVLWPVFRLSQDGHPLDRHDPAATRDGRIAPKRILIDWFCLVLIFQTVIWPLHMTAEWTFGRTTSLIATVVLWTLLTGLLIAVGCRSNVGTHRWIAMILCMALLIGEPMLMAIWPGPELSWTMRVSPLGLISTLLNDYDSWSFAYGGPQLICVGIAAVAGWIILAWQGRKTPRA